jgi:hypothetical protein
MQDTKSFCDDVFAHMMSTRGPKYKQFLNALKTFKYLSRDPAKGEFLESYYVLMRYIDDVVDGDARLPEKYSSSADFVKEKILFLDKMENPKDPIDHLIIHCSDVADRFAQDYNLESKAIMSSMLFDAERQGTWKVFPQKQLSHHFHMLDITGTVKATLKVFGEDPGFSPKLEPLGLASRLYYDLRDLSADLAAGYVNFSIESAAWNYIRESDIMKAAEAGREYEAKKIRLEDKLMKLKWHDYTAKQVVNAELEMLWQGWYENLPSGIQAWTKEHAKEGLWQLELHDDADYSSLGWLARATLPVVYARPARKYLEKIISASTSGISAVPYCQTRS